MLRTLMLQGEPSMRDAIARFFKNSVEGDVEGQLWERFLDFKDKVVPNESSDGT